MIKNRTPHALDRLLDTKDKLVVFLTAKRIHIGDLPDCRLSTTTVPVCRSSDDIPAGLMLPVVMATANSEVLFSPNNLGADLKTTAEQTFSDNGAPEGSMPNISNRAREQLPSLSPVRTGIIIWLIGNPSRFPEQFLLVTPGWLILDPIGWVSNH